MGVAVSFNYAGWIARYPEFATILEPTAQSYFDEATIHHRNDGGGPVSQATTQTVLLNMLTAHIAVRYNPGLGAQPNTPPGRVSNATEGSVTAAFENQYEPGTPQWYQQTKYGSDYWNATRVYRTARYRVPFSIGPNAVSRPWWGW